MRSASVLALARLVFEFQSTSIVRDMLGALIDTVLLLLKEESYQVIKAVVAFVKVIIAVLPRPSLKALLPKLVPALLGLSKSMKHHFKGKLRTVLEKFVRKFRCASSRVVPSSTPLCLTLAHTLASLQP